MTLNLMLTSPDAVYLSGDFRLVSVEDQAPLRDSYHTQKLIPVIRHEWTALIAYMGIQSAPPLIHDMGQWILERIDAIPPAGDFSQLSIALLELNRWLPRMCGDRRVAFSVVGSAPSTGCSLVMGVSGVVTLHLPSYRQQTPPHYAVSQSHSVAGQS